MVNKFILIWLGIICYNKIWNDIKGGKIEYFKCEVISFIFKCLILFF